LITLVDSKWGEELFEIESSSKRILIVGVHLEPGTVLCVFNVYSPTKTDEQCSFLVNLTSVNSSMLAEKEDRFTHFKFNRTGAGNPIRYLSVIDHILIN